MSEETQDITKTSLRNSKKENSLRKFLTNFFDQINLENHQIHWKKGGKEECRRYIKKNGKGKRRTWSVQLKLQYNVFTLHAPDLLGKNALAMR